MTTKPYRHAIPEDILALSHERDMLRRRGQYERADVLKRQIEEAGYVIKDNPHGAHLIILHSIEETQRCLTSVLRFAGNTHIEIILVDNDSQDELSIWAASLQHSEPRLHILRTSRPMGEAEARNIGLKQSQGCYILLLDKSVELTGDIFTPLAQVLSNEHIGITGLHGLHTDDLRHFVESQQREVEVIDKLCMAFRRNLLKKAGFFDERYRFPYYMDVDFNFAVRNTGADIMLTPDLPITCYPLLQDEGLSAAER